MKYQKKKRELLSKGPRVSLKYNSTQILISYKNIVAYTYLKFKNITTCTQLN